MIVTLRAMALLGLLAAPVKAAEDRIALLQLEDQWRAAQHKNDRAALEALLSDDVTFIGTSGSLRDRDDFLASRSTGALPRALTYDYADVVVRVYGSVGVVTGRESTTGEGTTFEARFTHVWAQRGGQWRLVAVQRTDIAK
jgi:ketosteroid isomerase-like protein